MPKIVFLDVDNTALAANSASLWIRRESRLGYVGTSLALRGAFWGVVYGLGFARMERVIASAAMSMRGVRESDIQARTIAFYDEEIRPLVRRTARARVAEHKARGDRVVLLTTSSNYLSHELSKDLGCDGYLCTRMEVVEGLFTGRIVPPLCFGEGKVEHARRYADSEGVPLSSCTYYGDSYSDLPVMLAVGEPVAVSPDPRLRRHAKRLGFRIEVWDEPHRGSRSR